jgi:HPt (histidine-containing phosphotransfer) domain-containing protein
MSDDPIDSAVYTELQEATGMEFVNELVETFLAEAPGMLADLKDASAENDPDRFRRAAHSIKSNASVFGATDLAELAREMELSGRADDPLEARAALDRLDAEFDRTATALRRLQNG